MTTRVCWHPALLLCRRISLSWLAAWWWLQASWAAVLSSGSREAVCPWWDMEWVPTEVPAFAFVDGIVSMRWCKSRPKVTFKIPCVLCCTATVRPAPEVSSFTGKLLAVLQWRSVISAVWGHQLSLQHVKYYSINIKTSSVWFITALLTTAMGRL